MSNTSIIQALEEKIRAVDWLLDTGKCQKDIVKQLKQKKKKYQAKIKEIQESQQ